MSQKELDAATDKVNSLAAIVIYLVAKSGGRITIRRTDLEKITLNLADGKGVTVVKTPDGEEWVAITLSYE